MTVVTDIVVAVTKELAVVGEVPCVVVMVEEG